MRSIVVAGLLLAALAVGYKADSARQVEAAPAGLPKCLCSEGGDCSCENCDCAACVVAEKSCCSLAKE